MGSAQRLSHLLVICGLHLAIALANSDVMAGASHRTNSKGLCVRDSSDQRDFNSTVSDYKLCDKNQGNCTVRLDDLRISMDDINSRYFVQYSHLKELKIQGSQLLASQASENGSYCLPDKIFCNLPNLTSFSVIDVPLRRGALLFFEDPCRKDDNIDLRHLQFSNDDIHFVPSLIGAYLPRLEHLDLSNNSIRSIPTLEVLNRLSKSNATTHGSNESLGLPSSLDIDLSNNLLTLLPVDVFPNLSEPVTQDGQEPPQVTVDVKNNPDLICLPPTTGHVQLKTDRYIPECCCNPLANADMRDLFKDLEDCHPLGASISLREAQHTESYGSSNLKLALSISGLAPNCPVKLPTMIEYSGYADITVLQGELIPFNEKCSCNFFHTQPFVEKSLQSVKGFISFIASFGDSNSSSLVEIEIPYPPSVNNSMFCIHKALLGFKNLPLLGNPLCIDMSGSIASEEAYIEDMSSPDDTTLDLVVVDKTQAMARSGATKHSSTHFNVKLFSWLTIVTGGIVAIVLIAVLGRNRCRKFRRAPDRLSSVELCMSSEDSELIGTGEPVAETQAGRQPLQNPTVDTENSSQLSTVASLSPSLPGPLPRLAMLFEFHHQNTHNSSRLVVGRAAESSGDFDSGGLVMGCALDHMNL